jgi:hypothetical protein
MSNLSNKRDMKIEGGLFGKRKKMVCGGQEKVMG